MESYLVATESKTTEHKVVDATPVLSTDDSKPEVGQSADTVSSSKVITIANNASLKTKRSGSTSPFSERHPKLYCFVPLALVVVTSLLPASVMLGIVYGCRVEADLSLFESRDQPPPIRSSYILVGYSANKFLIFSSWFSTLAQLLTSRLAKLYHLQTMRSLHGDKSRSHTKTSEEPAAEVKLLAAFRVGSSDGLLKYAHHRWHISKENPHQILPLPPQFHLTAAFVATINLLVICVFSADNVLHALTNGVDYSKISISPNPVYSFGRRLTDLCATFNRAENYCLPCTWERNGSQTTQLESDQRSNEIFRLEMASSRQSEIVHWTDGTDLKIAVLLPKPNLLPCGTEYSARTLGVATQCRPITPHCNPKSIGGQGLETQFNCTGTFFGVLGKAPLSSNNLYNKAPDPDVPPLCWKETANLQYGFFTSANLSTPYNPILYNSTTGDQRTVAAECPADSQLLNPVHMGVAARFNRANELAGGTLYSSPLVFDGSAHDSRLVDYVLTCTYTTYDVSYIWTVRGMQSFTATPNNGSVAEMFHGQLSYLGEGASDDYLSTNILRAAMAVDATEMAGTWADLYSERVLAVIGAYTVPERNVAEQVREEVVGALVHVGALWFVVGLALVYWVFAVVVGVLGVRAVCVDRDAWGKVKAEV